MRQPTNYVKAARKTFAFQENTSAPLFSTYSGGSHLLLIHSIRISNQLAFPSKPAKSFPSILLPFARRSGDLIALQKVKYGIKM
jgi:hypothetical protein